LNFKDKYTIIVKFTQNDNIPSSTYDKGWVDFFIDFLKTSLQYQITGDIDVVKKSETDLISAEDFNTSDLILYILSPAFVFSSNINQDAEILETAFNFDIPFINNKVKKVFKAPVKIEDLPLSLSTPTYYRFYDLNEGNSNEYATYEGWNEYQTNSEYWHVFADVVSDALKIFSQDENKSIGKIYISNKSDNYFKYRNTLKRELSAFDVEIFPDEDFSIEANYMEDPEIFFMKKCNLALHFPDEFLDLSSETRSNAFGKLPEKVRYIWFNPLETLIPERKAKYDELKIQLKPYQNIEAIESPIEELKSILKSKLLSPTSAETEDVIQKDVIYVLSDTKIDTKLRDLIQVTEPVTSKYEVKILSNVQNVADYRLMHYELLRKADRFMIFHFKNNSEWLKTMVSEIRKAPGFNREKPIAGKYIVTSTNDIPESYVNQQFKLINIDQPSDIIKVLPEIL
jgi:hypothetical protein